MTAVLVTLHVLVCIFLIAVVLLQRGKGAEIGAVFGGGASSTVFGSRGAGNFLTKLTTGAAIVFMLTSISLAYLWTETASDRLFDEGTGEESAAPAADEAAPFEEIDPAPQTDEAAAEGPAADRKDVP